MWSMERVTGKAALSLGEQKQQSHIERSRKVNAGKHLGKTKELPERVHTDPAKGYKPKFTLKRPTQNNLDNFDLFK